MMQRRRRKAQRVFISYSREGGQAHAVNFFRGLEQVLGTRHVFLDVAADAMEAGRSWKDSVRESLSGCDTLLLVFDPGMAARLKLPQNAVRFEIDTALEHGVTIACIRVNGAVLPPAAELPASLADFSERHSPEVHADAAVADIDRIIKELTGRSPGQVPIVDRWDLWILAALALLGVTGWLSLGRSLFNAAEAWLWSLALFMPWLLWMAARRLFATSRTGRASLRYRHAAAWIAALVAFGGGWATAYYRLYQLHIFSDASGILVSRLSGDPADRVQRELINRFRQDDRVVPEGAVETVAGLPRRVGFWWPGSGVSLEQGHTDARRFGSDGHAAVVVWGQLKDSSDAASRLAVNMTFIESKALFNTYGADVIGTLDRRELTGLDGDLGRLADTLPRLMNGYRLYHTARSEADFAVAEREFRSAIGVLEGHDPRDLSDQRALDEILASLHFYRANTLLVMGSADEAERAYQAAIDQTARDENGAQTPRYVEAASNLGWLLKRQGKLEQAIETLQAVAFTCDRDRLPERACAYVWYNLGGAYSDRDQHRQAAELFARAIDRVHKGSPDAEDRRLEAYAYQSRAYSLVRQAESAEAGAKVALLQDAEDTWKRGVDAISRAGLELPDYFRMVPGRVLIERRQWRQALDVLSTLKVPAERSGSLHALLAGAYSCTPNAQSNVETHLKGLVSTAISGSAAEGHRITIQEGMRMVSRIKRMCSEL